MSDAAKRVTDLSLAIVALLLLAPVIVVVAIAVKLSSPGPIIYRQTRVGRDGLPFQILKFRSMRVGCAGPSVTADDDIRITRVGRILRKYRLDEIPQLINIVCGDMSFVGPRPEVPKYVNLYPADVRSIVLSVKPGLTDPATLLFRDEQEILANHENPDRVYRKVILPKKLQMYVEYVNSRSWTFDISIIFRTLIAVFIRR